MRHERGDRGPRRRLRRGARTAGLTVACLAVACAALAVATVAWGVAAGDGPAASPMPAPTLALGRAGATTTVAVVVASPAPSPAGGPPAPAGNPTAQRTLESVRADVVVRDTSRRLLATATALGRALAPESWSSVRPDGNHLDVQRGDRVFDGAVAAAASLESLRVQQWASAGETQVAYAARLLATTALDDARCAGATTAALAGALRHLAQGDELYTVYAGPLEGVPSSPDAALRICAVGSSDAGTGCVAGWAAGEQHAFDVTVAFPSRGAADNAYQGMSGSLRFVWARS